MEADIRKILQCLASQLVDQETASVLVPPQAHAEGYWFGGGNVVVDAEGTYWLCGRYRNQGDSRTGVGAGERGLELAIFRAESPLGPWQKALSFTKEDLVCNAQAVVSIEGASLLLREGSVELFVSTEKKQAYPDAIQTFQKEGTGCWDIDMIPAESIDQLKGSNIRQVVHCADPAALHVKDPVVFNIPGSSGATGLIFCTHPYTWASSNTGLALREADATEFSLRTMQLLGRGAAWDVAATRITDRMPIPALGRLSDMPEMSLYFYDGAECLRSLDENPAAVSRPRGYSCEEIGGLACGVDSKFPELTRISTEEPLFVSPYGTGCSRYVSTLVTEEGILATWQQSQPDLSQPLVGNFVEMDRIVEILG
ncbi:MAG: exo-alpha-sialidase [Verrucomicrobiaceae bacterium]|nr:exo-alpha-sialidase [Verrucomicrobiaceae bacterium]